MPTPVDTRITPSLHSETLREVDGYDETMLPHIAAAFEALDDAYLTIAKIHDARDAAKKNQAWTPEQAVLAVSEAAYKQQQRLLKKFDGLVATMDKQIAHFEQELSQPLESRAAVTVAGEIRSYAKNLTTEERHKFLQQAIDAGDQTTVSACLGAPSYLSGLDANFAKTYVRFWHEKMNPQSAQRLKAIRGAKAHIEKVGPLIMGQVEKAMGSDWGRVKALREGNSKALAALKFGE